jgi:hypothetical protein
MKLQSTSSLDLSPQWITYIVYESYTQSLLTKIQHHVKF